MTQLLDGQERPSLHTQKCKEVSLEATVTAKGQTTIPKEIREKLGLKAGSKIKFFLRHDGEAVILPVAPGAALRGRVSYRGPPVTIEEMDDAIAAEVSERDERSRRR